MESEFKSLKLYEEEILTLLSLPDKSQGRILKAILSECVGKETSQLNAMETAVFTLIFGQIKRAEELSNKRRQNASARWKDVGDKQNDASDMQKNANAMQNSCKDDAILCTNTYTNTNTNTNTKTPLSAADAAGGEGVDKNNSEKDNNKALEERFERFWSCYPKKAAKQDALNAWKKLKPDDGLTEKILSAVEQFKKTEQWRKDDGQFIPYPVSWLDGRRWEDDIRTMGFIKSQTPQINKRSSSINIDDVVRNIRNQYRKFDSWQ